MIECPPYRGMWQSCDWTKTAAEPIPFPTDLGAWLILAIAIILVAGFARYVSGLTD